MESPFRNEQFNSPEASSETIVQRSSPNGKPETYQTHAFLNYLTPQFITLHGQEDSRLQNSIFYVGILTLCFAVYGIVYGRPRIRNFLVAFSLLTVYLGTETYKFLFKDLPFASINGPHLDFSGCWVNLIILTLAAIDLRN